MCCCYGRVLTASSAFASPLHPAAHGGCAGAASVAGTSAGRRAPVRAPVSMLCMMPPTLRGGVDTADGLDASDIVHVLHQLCDPMCGPMCAAPLTPCRQVPQGVRQARRGRQSGTKVRTPWWCDRAACGAGAPCHLTRRCSCCCAGRHGQLDALVASVHRRYGRPRGWWTIGRVVDATTVFEAVHVDHPDAHRCYWVLPNLQCGKCLHPWHRAARCSAQPDP